MAREGDDSVIFGIWLLCLVAGFCGTPLLPVVVCGALAVSFWAGIFNRDRDAVVAAVAVIALAFGYFVFYTSQTLLPEVRWTFDLARIVPGDLARAVVIGVSILVMLIVGMRRILRVR